MFESGVQNSLHQGVAQYDEIDQIGARPRHLEEALCRRRKRNSAMLGRHFTVTGSMALDASALGPAVVDGDRHINVLSRAVASAGCVVADKRAGRTDG